MNGSRWLLLLAFAVGVSAGLVWPKVWRAYQGPFYNSQTFDCPPNHQVQVIGPEKGDGWLVVVEKGINAPVQSRRIENIEKCEGFGFDSVNGNFDYVWYNDSAEMQVGSLKVR
ncbi:hypothetical protein [Luteolibacter marinus]|uniref:hypothetical protein n=1 Tax=Luteolibacter marinus TaxID=2776705 RepID=UPI001866502A|nr:hypothetical protein [Luteolibacter marinus]